jgi:dimethylallyldiphosphate transferase
MSPLWKHLQINKPIGDLIVQAIKDLGHETVEYMHSLAMLEAFLDSGAAEKAGVSAAFFSFDTNLSDKYKSSRIKIYLATPHTAFDRLVAIFTLGGRLNGPEMERAIAALRLLWSSVMNMPEDISNDTDISPLNPNGCANVIFNFEIWSGAPFPTPKIYPP